MYIISINSEIHECITIVVTRECIIHTILIPHLSRSACINCTPNYPIKQYIPYPSNIFILAIMNCICSTCTQYQVWVKTYHSTCSCTGTSMVPVREAMSEVYVHQDEQVTTKKAPYLRLFSTDCNYGITFLC